MKLSPTVLTLISQIELGPINLGYSHDRHHSILQLFTDDQGKLDIWSNANLTGRMVGDSLMTILGYLEPFWLQMFTKLQKIKQRRPRVERLFSALLFGSLSYQEGE